MKMKSIGIFGALALAVFLPAGFALADERTAELVNAECWFTPPEGTEPVCGWLQAPENRDDESNRRVIRMPVVILEGIEGGDGPFAVVLGGGGPGGGLGLDDPEHIVIHDEYRKDALGYTWNLVLMDQRGAGMSKPLLACPDFDPEFSGKDYMARSTTLDEDFRLIARHSEHCVKQFAEWEIDLSAYTTAASADDFEDLRKLLGVDGPWNVIGNSYGTRLAFELIRRHPDGVEAVVMNGVAPPEASSLLPRDSSAAALVKIADACQEDDFCRTTYGDLLANLEIAAAKLEKDPVTVTLPYRNFESATVVINANRLGDIVSQGMYSEFGIALLPCLIWELAGGPACRFVDQKGAQFALDRFASQYAELALDDSYADALFEVIACRERGFPEVENKREEFPFAFWSEWTNRAVSLCRDIWAKEGGEIPEARTPVATEKPILMLTGFFDPATPSEWAAATAKRLPNAWVYQFPSSHNGEGLHECQDYLTRQFLNPPFGEINDACVRQAEPLPFY